MLGRHPSGIIVERPLKDGVISDLDLATEMLQTFIKKINIGSLLDLGLLYAFHQVVLH